MSTLELEHLKHTSSSTNNLSVHSDGSLTLGMLQGNVGIGTSSPANFGGTTLQVNHASSYSSVLASSGAYTMQFMASQTNGVMNMGARSNHHVSITTNDTPRLTISTAGHVTMPNQPAWFGTHTDNYATTWSGGQVFNMIANTANSYNVGNHFDFSTERFTAPIAGHYLVFGWDIRENGKEATGVGLGVYKNGLGSSNRVVNSYHQNQRGYAFSSVVYLAVNDWISFGVTEGGGVAGLFYGSGAYSGYGVRLIG